MWLIRVYSESTLLCDHFDTKIEVVNASYCKLIQLGIQIFKITQLLCCEELWSHILTIVFQDFIPKRRRKQEWGNWDPRQEEQVKLVDCHDELHKVLTAAAEKTPKAEAAMLEVKSATG